MKSILKKVAGLAIAAVLALGMAGCSDDSSNDSGNDNNTPAITKDVVYETKDGREYYTFKPNGVLTYTVFRETFTGSYSGDPTKDGSINVVDCFGVHEVYTITNGVLYDGEDYFYLKKDGNSDSGDGGNNPGSGDTTKETVAKPAFSVSAGKVESGTSVTITCSTEGAKIYYTTDGSAPTAKSTEYTTAIIVTEAVTLKAIAVKDGMNDSTVASASYTIKITNDESVLANVAKYFNDKDGLLEEFKEKKIIAWYAHKASGYKYSYSMFFFEDKSYCGVAYSGSLTSNNIKAYSKGIFSGNPAVDGSFLQKHVAYGASSEWMYSVKIDEVEIKGGKFNILGYYDEVTTLSKEYGNPDFVSTETYFLEKLAYYMNSDDNRFDEFKTKTAVAIYESLSYSYNSAYIFFDDNTYCYVGLYVSSSGGDTYKGTFTGDVNADGKIEMTQTHSSSGGEWREYNYSRTYYISKESFYGVGYSEYVKL